MNWNNDNTKLLSSTSLQGKPVEDGGIGVKLPYSGLLQQLMNVGQAKPHNKISQIDVYEDGIVLLYEPLASNIDLIKESK